VEGNTKLTIENIITATTIAVTKTTQTSNKEPRDTKNIDAAEIEDLGMIKSGKERLLVMVDLQQVRKTFFQTYGENQKKKS